MTFPSPGVGEWYRLQGGASFEVVAVDEDDGTLEVQYVDGTVEEIDLADWRSWGEQRLLTATDPGEDWSDAADVEADEGRFHEGRPYESYGDEREIRTWSLDGGLDGIDLFEAG